jgi:hypothetical protein
MDRSAVGHDYIAKVEKHESQRDYSTGFGGKFGVQSDRQDKVQSTTHRIGEMAGFQIELHIYVTVNTDATETEPPAHHGQEQYYHWSKCI